MFHARFPVAVFSLITVAATLLGGTLVVDEGQALGAARRTVKHVLRSARATNGAAAPTSSAGLSPSDNAKPADTPRADTAASRRNRETATRAPRARRSNDVANGAKRTSDPARDGSPVKTPSGSVAAAKGSTDPTRASVLPETTKPAPEAASGRGTDAHPAAAKTPNEASAIGKSTAEKFAPEPLAPLPSGGDVDSARPAADLAAPSVRRDGTLGAGAATAARPAVVSFDGPVFDGGDVPRAAAALDRMKGALTRCASADTALTKSEASIDLRFLVRAPGRAEGVGVDKSRGLSGDVVRCMTSVLSRAYMGAPSDDPVGVAVTVRVRRPEAANN